MITKTSSIFSSNTFYFILAFSLGLIPAIAFIHMFAKDFVGYYLLSESFRQYHSYAFVNVAAYRSLEPGLQARAPLLPLMLTLSTLLFGKTLFAIYLPIFVSRLLVTPLTFLVSRFFLPLPIAFLASSLTVFFPKLQTFSLSAFEADSFVLVFYMFALFFYFRFIKTNKNLYLFLTGLFLGLLTLVKELGLPISVGFIFAVLIEKYLHKPSFFLNLKSSLFLVIPFLVLVFPFFAYTFVTDGNLYFSAVTTDRNIKYLPDNLPILLQAIPYYFLGLDNVILFNQTIKNFIINLLILILFLSGLSYFFAKRRFTLILPVLFTFSALGILNTISIGGDSPWNFELITIFAFAMPIAAIFIFKGLMNIIDYFVKKFKSIKKYSNVVYLVICLILMLKFINNYFSKPFTQDFSGDYYVSMKTIISNSKVLPKFSFERDLSGNLVVKDLSPLIIHMRNEYRSEKVDIFTAQFKLITISLIFIGFVYALLKNLFSELLLSKLRKGSRSLSILKTLVFKKTL